MVKFPKKSLGKQNILDRLDAAEKKSDFAFYEKNFFDVGPHLVSSASLPWADEVRQFVVEAYKRFIYGQVFGSKSIEEFEQEVISMMGGLIGNENAVGNITSGGSESIFLGMLAAKFRARSTGKSKPGHNGSVLIPKTAHFAFFKACRMFDLEPIVVELLPGSATKVDLDAMRKAVRDDTIAIIGTAGSYPYGHIDPIEEMGGIAEEKGLYFHVDACQGGFILPFLEMSGYDPEIPKWDFRVKGVSSISADLHKHGMLPPPASCIFYRSEELRSFAKKVATPRGCLTGSAPAGPIAASWAILNLLGVEGYIQLARKSMELKETMKKGVMEIQGLKIVPDSKINILLMYSEEYDLHPVFVELCKRHWATARVNFPRPTCIFMLFNSQNEHQIKTCLDDLKTAMKLAEPIRSKAEVKTYGPDYPMTSGEITGYGVYA